MKYSARLTAALIPLLLFVGCSSDNALSPTQTNEIPAPGTEITPPAQDLSELADVFAMQAEREDFVVSMQRSEHPGRTVVRLPAGSVDGLTNALALAGRGGVVIVEEGDHIENSTVLIEHRVTIVGRPGATITSGVGSTNVSGRLEPALHVRGARGVVLWGLGIGMAQDPGGTAILVDHSVGTTIVDCSISAAQFGVLVEEGNRTRIVGNTIVGTSAWLSGELDEVHGIVIVNGERCWIYGNNISNAVFGAWACDLNGRASANEYHGNLIGLILCNVPPEGFAMPDGSLIGSEVPGTQWFVWNDNATGNFDAGYLVIDGATRNFLYDNDASNNGTYDIELVGDSMRFGFLTPTSHDNIVLAGSHPELIVKDCGVDNHLFGFSSIVDNGSDPCF